MAVYFVSAASFARRDNNVVRQRTCAEQLSHVTSDDVIAELPPRLAGLWLSTRSVPGDRDCAIIEDTPTVHPARRYRYSQCIIFTDAFVTITMTL